MPPGISLESNLDLITATLDVLNKRRISQTQATRDYVGVRLFFREGVLRQGGAIGRRSNIRLRASGTAKFVNLFETRPFEIKQLLGQMTTRFRQFDDKYAFDEREEDMNSMDEAVIIDLVAGRRDSCYENQYELLEQQVWSPGVSASDALSIRGVPYWLRGVAAGLTDPVGGFNGTTVYFEDGTNNTLYDSLDASDVQNARLASYCATYDGRVTPDLVATIRRANLMTRFTMIPELQGDDATGPRRSRKFLCVPDSIYLEIEELAEQGPDDNDGELMKFSDKATVGRMKPIPVPELEADPLMPIYCVDPSRLYGFRLKDRFMKERKPQVDPNNANIVQVQMDTSVNMHCDNPRHAGYVIHMPRAA